MRAEDAFRKHLKGIDDKNFALIAQAIEIQAGDHPKKKMLPEWNITYAQANQVCVLELERRTKPVQNGSDS